MTRFSLLLLSLLVPAAHAGGDITLVVGNQALQAEVAATPEARQRGLMGRTHLAADRGMLFVFDTPGRYCFWMRDTPLPLAIAFIDADGRVIQRADMQPRSETPHCPPAEVRYALEIAQGSHLRAALAPGARVTGLPR
ncbi:MAG: DUF192 domain-containing protein [Thiobacillus sp.]|nr:DUF192 domain-containing protein [Thiobacillus sp.]